MSSVIAAGAALATIGVLGRIIVRQGALTSVKYYKGGFEPVMNKREASLILGLSANSHPDKIKLAHKRIMLLNHPDKGGSPYMAAKINEAKDLLDKSK